MSVPNKLTLSEGVEGVLSNAREVYGNTHEVVVCMGELSELSSVLAKYQRYCEEDEAVSELRASVLGEVADVMISLNHIMSIFKLDDETVSLMVNAKAGRLARWLSNSSSPEETMRDRAITQE